MSARELLEKVLNECGTDENLYHISSNLFGEITLFLERPEPEPIGFMRDDGDGWFEFSSHDDEGAFPVYTTTPDQSARIAELAKPEPEPVLWATTDVLAPKDLPMSMRGLTPKTSLVKSEKYRTPLYAEPPQRKPLSEQEILDCTEKVIHRFDFDKDENFVGFVKIVRAIEKVHGIE